MATQHGGIDGETCQYYVNPASVGFENAIKRFTKQIPRKNLIIEQEKVIGHGGFAEVFKGYIQRPGKKAKIPVAVKMIKKGKEKEDLLYEACNMSQFKHPNVTKFEAVVSETHPQMIIMEYMENGSLQKYLQENKDKLSVPQLIKMMKDVALGMEYLNEEKNYVHRDLAARNVLVNKSLVCKISDFTLSREKKYSIEDEGIYKMQDGGIFSWRWTAPDTIESNIFKNASDVWSFGVVMWEIFEFGTFPYKGKNDQQVLEYLKSGKRLLAPHICPPALYQLMLKCWDADPKLRPTFSSIVKKLQNFIESLHASSNGINHNHQHSNMAAPALNGTLQDRPLHCDICKIDLQGISLSEHVKTSPHRRNFLKYKYHIEKKSLIKDKKGVVINVEQITSAVHYKHDIGEVQMNLLQGHEEKFKFIINNQNGGSILIRQVDKLAQADWLCLSDQHQLVQKRKYIRLEQGEFYAIDATVFGERLGALHVLVAFQMLIEETKELFYIIRPVAPYVHDEVSKDCMDESPYQPHVVGPSWEFGDYERGIPLTKEPPANIPSAKSNIELERVSLSQYFVPKGFREAAKKKFNPKKVSPEYVEDANNVQAMMGVGLTSDNYPAWFNCQLWLEEMQLGRDIHNYDREANLKEVMPHSNIRLLELEVPGLAENRPSVLKNDSVMVRNPSGEKVYEGRVHKVTDKTLHLAFGPQFMSKFLPNLKVEVKFEFNRYPLRMAHRAVSNNQEVLKRLCFPQSPTQNASQNILRIIPYNRDLENNAEQLDAVQHIVAGSSGDAPYLIFGPPGTGKTVTVVEAIKQIYKCKPQSRILACAPSNSAADLLATRLLEHIGKNHIIRLNAVSREPRTISPKLQEISNVASGEVYVPEVQYIMQFRVVVCTLVTSGRLVNGGIPREYLTHIVLDECGHAMEPEALIPISGIVGPKAQVIIAGDHHQLGPVIRNQDCFSSAKYFKGNGLDMSFLERLMKIPMYMPHEDPVTGKKLYDNRCVTKLKKNYRSNAEIIHTSNKLFYDSELEVCADPDLSGAFRQWQHLPKPGFPMIFHDVRGKDEREGNSPSFYNAAEVSKVLHYVGILLDTRSPNIQPKDIGIVTPYRRQVEKIRKQLEKQYKNTRILISNIKVGSAEEFQGDERHVMIISTVRSSVDQLAYDHKFKLGFLRNPKRFNVSVTRAKALLIVVGCPVILSLDEHWGELLSYIKNNGGYIGKEFGDDTANLDDILARFERLDLLPTVDDDDGVGVIEVAEGPAWRAEH